VKEGKSRFKFDSLERQKMATFVVLPEGVGKNQSNLQQLEI
jgi:hypothetical protein